MVGLDSQLPTLLLDLFWYVGTVGASYGAALVGGWTVTAADRSDETTVRYLRQLAVSGGMLVALASLAFLLYVGVTIPLYRGLGAAFPTDGGTGRILHLLAVGVICLGPLPRRSCWAWHTSSAGSATSRSPRSESFGTT